MSPSKSSKESSWPKGRIADVRMVGEVREQKEGQILGPSFTVGSRNPFVVSILTFTLRWEAIRGF